MGKFDRNFMKEMKTKQDVDLLGVASIDILTSQELRDMATSLSPGVKSVVVLGKEIYKEVVALLKPYNWLVC